MKKGERKRENGKLDSYINAKLGRIKAKRTRQESKNNMLQGGEKYNLR
jgi:hypothetical protein